MSDSDDETGDLDISQLPPEMRRLYQEAVDTLDPEAYYYGSLSDACACELGENPVNDRKFVDLLMEAVLAAPSPWTYGRLFLFDKYVETFIKVPGLENLSDRKALQSLLKSSKEPALYRGRAALALSRFETEFELQMDYLRQVLEIAGQVEPSDVDRPVLGTGDRQFEPTVGGEVQHDADVARRILQKIETQVATRFKVVADGPESSIEGRKFLARLDVGGKACDCCGKTLQELGVVRLDCCVRCKMAYYCSKECQSKQWKAGHNQACRKPGDIRQGDFMFIRELVARPELNGEVVEVGGPDPKSEGRWAVRLIVKEYNDKELSVATGKLFHIRPAM